MRKLRSDSKWHKVPSQAREQVIHWLFEEGLSYDAALKRLEKEFGVKVSRSGLVRFYRHVDQQRAMAGLNLPAVNGEQFRAATLKLLEVAAFNAGLDHDRPETGRQFIPLMKLLMQQSDRELKEQWLKLEFERLGLDMQKIRKT